MAGITAVSASKTHAAGSTTTDANVSGFLVGERIVLGTSPTGAGYQWSLAAPTDSAVARSALDDELDATPSFIPDVSGFFTVTALVGGVTQYVLRCEVSPVAILRSGEGFRLTPLANAQVPTPQTGVVLYYSTESSKAVVKDSSGTVTPLY